MLHFSRPFQALVEFGIGNCPLSRLMGVAQSRNTVI